MKDRKKKRLRIRLADTTRKLKKIKKNDELSGDIKEIEKSLENITSTMKLPRVDFSSKSVPKICSWCNALYSIEAWEVDEEKRTGVSHGICPRCYKKMQEDME